MNILRPIPKPAQPGSHLPSQPAHVQPLLSSQQGQTSHFQPQKTANLLKSSSQPSLLQSLQENNPCERAGAPNAVLPQSNAALTGQSDVGQQFSSLKPPTGIDLSNPSKQPIQIAAHQGGQSDYNPGQLKIPPPSHRQGQPAGAIFPPVNLSNKQAHPTSGQNQSAPIKTDHMLPPEQQSAKAMFGQPQPGVFAPSISHSQHLEPSPRPIEIKKEIKSEVQSEETEDSESSSDKSSESEHTGERDSGSVDKDGNKALLGNPLSEIPRDVKGNIITQGIKQEPIDSYGVPPYGHTSHHSGTSGHPGLIHGPGSIKQEPRDVPAAGVSQQASVIQQKTSSSQDTRDHNQKAAAAVSGSNKTSQGITSNPASGSATLSTPPTSQQVTHHHHHPLHPHHPLLPPSHLTLQPPHHLPLPHHLPPGAKLPHPHSVHLQIPQVPHPTAAPPPPSMKSSLPPHSLSSPSSPTAMSRPLPLTGHSPSTTLPLPPPLVSLPQSSIPHPPPHALAGLPPGAYPPNPMRIPHHPGTMTAPGGGSGRLQSMSRPRSPMSLQRGSVSPPRERSRSRSPLIRPQSDSDSEPPSRSPEPEPFIVDEQCYRSKSAM